MAFQPNSALLGTIGQGSDYKQSSAQMMQSAASAMGQQRPVRVDEQPGIGGALQGAMGGALSMAGTGAALTAAGMGGVDTIAMAMGGLPGLAIGAGIGLLSSIFD
jgi:hypothetical protein